MTRLSKIWFCSDWHFNHDKPFIYLPRGYNSIEEMNKDIVNKHNSKVRKDDLVFCLGDCCMGGAEKNAENERLIESLNGKIVIIRGNHDGKRKIEMYQNCKNVVGVVSAYYLDYKKYSFLLTHHPSLTGNRDEHKPLKGRLINLAGHTHTDDPFNDIGLGTIYHVEMDAHGCFPIDIDSIIEDCKKKGL